MTLTPLAIRSRGGTALRRLAAMSAIATHSSHSAGTTAPWKPLFLNHLSKMSSPEFIMATIHPASDSNPASAGAAARSTSGFADASPTAGGAVPRLRYLIFRGMWTELPPNHHNEAPRNEQVYESDMPTFTTDSRMEKVPGLFASSAGHGLRDQAKGSGGGGPVEAVWWVKELMTQWRIRGDAFVVGPDIESSDDSGVRTVKSELGKRMRPTHRQTGEPDWSWEKELTGHFGNLSPMMRGSFKNPPPGTSVSNPPSNPELSVGQKVMDLHDSVARENFRVVVIRPFQVEQLDLSNPDKARRWRFTFVGEGDVGNVEGERIGEWVKQELWP